ncbi:MAG: PDZ domain-containing protein, partial [Candidatus Omnitrophota bacterium]
MRRRALKFTISALISISVIVMATIAVSKEKRVERDDLYRNINLFSDTFATISNEYVEDVDSQQLIYGALKGMLSSLDAHSQFLDPDTYNELMVETTGEFGGLGIEITIQDNLLTVITPIEDTPAWRAGIKAGDRIVKIKEEVTRDITIFEAVKKMRG